MAPRITAEEAVEFLKIHQIRKENKLLYDEIHSLRDEVVACRSAHQQIQQNVSNVEQTTNQVQALSAEYTNRLTTIDGTVQRALEDITSCISTHEKLRKDVDRQSTILMNSSTTRNSDIKNVSEKLVELESRLHQRITATEDPLIQLQSNVEPDTVNAIQEQLRVLCRKFDHLNAEVAALSLPQTSVEKHLAIEHETSDPTILVPATPSQRDSSPSFTSMNIPDTSPLRDLDDSSGDEGMMLNVDQVEVLPHASSISGLSVNESHGNVGSVAGESSGEKSMPLPVTDLGEVRSNFPGRLKLLSELTRLKQLETEMVLPYFRRLQARTSLLPQSTDCARIYLKRFLLGLGDDGSRNILKQWLETSQWSVEEAENCSILLDAINTCCAQENRGQNKVEHSGITDSEPQHGGPEGHIEPEQTSTSQSASADGLRLVSNRNVRTSKTAIREGRDPSNEQQQTQQRVMPSRRCKRKVEFEDATSNESPAKGARLNNAGKHMDATKSSQRGHMNENRARDEIGRFVSSSVHRVEANNGESSDRITSDDEAQEKGENQSPKPNQDTRECNSVPDGPRTAIKFRQRRTSVKLKPDLVRSKGGGGRPSKVQDGT